jgi:hypothetical protein
VTKITQRISFKIDCIQNKYYFLGVHEMSAEKDKTYTTPKTYRLTTEQAFELSQTATLLRIPESRLVRILLDKGLQEIYKK